MRLFRTSSTIFSLFIFFVSITISGLLFLSYLPTPSHAAEETADFSIPGMIKFLQDHKSIQDYGKEFCDKRNGDLMNLETWFSGKCGEDIDTLSGEGVGFVDIITLQGIETLIGPQQEGMLSQLINLIGTLKNIQETLIGTAPVETKIAQIQQINDQKDTGGLISQAIKTSATLLKSKPASSLDYLAYASGNLKENRIIKSSYAASPGYGFSSLSPLLPVWRAFRNIAYILFALAFVVYGIMIMFRVRIDSKTAASISLAIPRLITTLLIITFSYAIVGFMIDISTVLSSLGISVLAVGEILNLNLWTSSLVPVIGGLHGGWLGGIGSLLINSLVAIVVLPFIVISFIFAPFAKLFGTILALAGLVTGWGIIISIILFLAILWSYAQLIFKLFQSFLSVIISLIFSPIILLGNIFPGSKSFQKWIMGIMGNLAAFPAAVFFLVLSYSLMVQPLFSILQALNSIATGAVNISPSDLSAVLGVNQLAKSDAVWAPPLTFSFGQGMESDIILAVIGLGILLMASKYVDMVMKAFNVDLFPYGAAIGDALKMGSKGNNYLASQNYNDVNWLGKPLSKRYGSQNDALGNSTVGEAPTVGQLHKGITFPGK